MKRSVDRKSKEDLAVRSQRIMKRHFGLGIEQIVSVNKDILIISSRMIFSLFVSLPSFLFYCSFSSPFEIPVPLHPKGGQMVPGNMVSLIP